MDKSLVKYRVVCAEFDDKAGVEDTKGNSSSTRSRLRNEHAEIKKIEELTASRQLTAFTTTIVLPHFQGHKNYEPHSLIVDEFNDSY